MSKKHKQDASERFFRKICIIVICVLGIAWQVAWQTMAILAGGVSWLGLLASVVVIAYFLYIARKAYERARELKREL